MLALAGRDHFHFPALRRRIALIHPEKVAGEDGGLVAAGAGANLEDHVAFVGRILGQQENADVVFHLCDARVELRLLGRGHIRHLASGRQHVLDVAPLAIGLLQPHGGARRGLELGILLRQLHEGFA